MHYCTYVQYSTEQYKHSYFLTIGYPPESSCRFRTSEDPENMQNTLYKILPRMNLYLYLELMTFTNLFSDDKYLYYVGILDQSMGARNRVGIGLSYRPARLHYIGWLACATTRLLYSVTKGYNPLQIVLKYNFWQTFESENDELQIKTSRRIMYSLQKITLTCKATSITLQESQFVTKDNILYSIRLENKKINGEQINRFQVFLCKVKIFCNVYFLQSRSL